VGETRVDLLHLLEDLRDAYPGSTEETILSEIVANSLDSGATTIAITTDSTTPALTIIDDGEGMRRRDLARYHDVAASAKIRGAGIGFAGVGIKIALLVCTEVVTETRRGRHHVASSWRLASRHRAPWRWIPPPGLVATRGTAVRLTPTSALSPLLDPGFVESVLRWAFEPLLDPALAEILRSPYPRGTAIVLNGHALERQGANASEVAPLSIRIDRKRKPAGAGYLLRAQEALSEERRGVAVSTFGKVIRRGWDWLALTPGAPERVGGLIEVPALAECLTLNKADFIRSGSRGAMYLAYRKAIQEAVSHQLQLWGDIGEPGERARRRAARPVERDLEGVLADLADDFPMLAPLVEQRAGGQRRLPTAGSGSSSRYSGPLLEPREGAPQLVEAATPDQAPLQEQPPSSLEAAPPPRLDSPQATGHLAAGSHMRRPVRYGLSIQFEARPDDVEVARLVESTVWINEGHPAYRRAAVSRSEGYHIALAVALAIAPLAVDPAKEHTFITAFLARWGAAIERRGHSRRH
jgi:Histidine kinase-, DNA gyrase B-, and HSP90-like ATPase